MSRAAEQAGEAVGIFDGYYGDRPVRILREEVRTDPERRWAYVQMWNRSWSHIVREWIPRDEITEEKCK